MVRTMKGRHIDMGAIAAANGHVRAIGTGNVLMNARGDRIDLKGNIVKTREQIDKEIEAYYRENPKAVKHAALSTLDSEIFASPADVFKAEPNKIVVVAPVPVDQRAPLPPKARKVISDE